MVKRTKEMVRGELIKKDNHYEFYVPNGSSAFINKSSGNGRVFEYLLRNKTKTIPLERIASLSGWKNPDKQMRKLIPVIEGWSSYEIWRDREGDKIWYSLTDKTHRYGSD